MPTTTCSARTEAVSVSRGKAVAACLGVVRSAVRLALPVITFVLAACQPAVHGRQPVTPAWNTVAAFVSRNGPSRIRVGEYTVADLRASAATRHWPLMDSRTLSHRYGFDVQKDGGRQQGVQCVLITISGNETRDRSTLECTVQAEDSWRIELSGRSDFDGTITGNSRHYTVRSVGSTDVPVAGRSTKRSGYLVLDSDAPVATVEFDGGAEPWLDPTLDDAGQGVVAATVVALLVGHELGQGVR
jgi:hypothetical protein